VSEVLASWEIVRKSFRPGVLLLVSTAEGSGHTQAAEQWNASMALAPPS